MSLWTLLDGGNSVPQRDTWGQRFALWAGRRLATRMPNVTIHPSCRISPAARICPRQGAIHIDADCSVAPGAIVQGNVRIGAGSTVQAYAVLVGYGTVERPTGQITIGKFVRIAPHVMMIAANHVFANVSKPIAKQGLEHKPIVIEDDVWIGGRVSIVAGVRVGTGSVIGAGAVVTHDIPPYSVAVGVPARVIKSRRPGPATSPGMDPASDPGMDPQKNPEIDQAVNPQANQPTIEERVQR